MLRALALHGIRPDLVLGTSIGALNGAFIAADPGPRAPTAWPRCGRRSCARGVFLDNPVRQAARGEVPHPPAVERPAAPRHRALPAGRPLRTSRCRSSASPRASRTRAGVVRGGRPRRPGRRVVLGARACSSRCASGTGTSSTAVSCRPSIPVGRALALGATRIFSLYRAGWSSHHLLQALGGGHGGLRDRPAAPVRARDGERAGRRRDARAAERRGPGARTFHRPGPLAGRMRDRMDAGAGRERRLPQRSRRADDLSALDLAHGVDRQVVDERPAAAP